MSRYCSSISCGSSILCDPCQWHSRLVVLVMFYSILRVDSLVDSWMWAAMVPCCIPGVGSVCHKSCYVAPHACWQFPCNLRVTTKQSGWFQSYSFAVFVCIDWSLAAFCFHWHCFLTRAFMRRETSVTLRPVLHNQGSICIHDYDPLYILRILLVELVILIPSYISCASFEYHLPSIFCHPSTQPICVSEHVIHDSCT